MPSPTTALDLITRSMRLAKVLAAGETPTADEANDALATLNDILENWDVEPLSLWGTSNFVGATIPGRATYTIGPAGDLNTTRPARISDAYVTFGNVDFRVEPIGQVEYNSISVKSLAQPIPQKLLYVDDFPLGLITLWPVPTQAIPLVLTVDRKLTQIPNLQTTINYPPAAAMALRYQLALQLATEYGVPLDPALAALASDAKADYKRSNKRRRTATVDAGLMHRGGFINWRTGD